MSNSVKTFKAKMAEVAKAIRATQETAIVDVALKGKTPTTGGKNTTSKPNKREVVTKVDTTVDTTGKGRKVTVRHTSSGGYEKL